MKKRKVDACKKKKSGCMKKDKWMHVKKERKVDA